MRHGRMVYVLGNVNGQFDMLDTFIDEIVGKNALLASMCSLYEENGYDFQAMILQCGDFAYFWPGDEIPEINNRIDWLPGGRIPIYWIGGNHEDWDELDRLGLDISEVGPRVFYCPFGTTLNLSPDVSILFAGGTESSWKDKIGRLFYMKDPDYPKIWWEQEGISDADMERLSLVPKADWVISHTAPYAFGVSGKDAESRKKLDKVLLKYRPKRWFFSHFTRFAEGKTDGCRWVSLSNMLKGGFFWDKVWMEWEEKNE